jgi:HK97 gp10 family phage protein
MTAKIEGMEELKRNLDHLAKKYGEATIDAAHAGANLVKSEAQASMQRVSAGEEAIRYRAQDSGESTQRVVTVSLPGDAPNTDTGRLIGSIAVEVSPSGIFVGTSVPYGAHLEYGTRRMPARPWLVPAMEKKRGAIKRLFQKAADPKGKGGTT